MNSRLHNETLSQKKKKPNKKKHVVVQVIILARGRLEQKNHEFKPSLDNTASPCLKNQTKKKGGFFFFLPRSQLNYTNSFSSIAK
jgi:hypothetical protein